MVVLAALATGELQALAAFPHLTNPAFVASFVVAAMAGLVLTYTSALCTTYNSPLATSITGNVKDLATTSAGWALFGGFAATTRSLTGLALSFAGAGMYSLVSLQKSKASSAAAAAAVAAAAAPAVAGASAATSGGSDSVYGKEGEKLPGGSAGDDSKEGRGRATSLDSEAFSERDSEDDGGGSDEEGGPVGDGLDGGEGMDDAPKADASRGLVRRFGLGGLSMSRLVGRVRHAAAAAVAAATGGGRRRPATHALNLSYTSRLSAPPPHLLTSHDTLDTLRQLTPMSVPALLAGPDSSTDVSSVEDGNDPPELLPDGGGSGGGGGGGSGGVA